MTSVLVVDDDASLCATLARDLVRNGFDVRVADGVDTALAVLAREPIDVALVDLRMRGKDGIDLLAAMRDVSESTRAVLTSAFASARDHQIATELGAVRVLCKPFTPAELLDAIRQAEECRTGFRGSFHGLSLMDMLQMLHYGRRSTCVTVAGRPGGTIAMRNGEIVHAECGELRGEAALAAILSRSSGAIQTSALGATETTITRSLQELLLDVVRVFDEERETGAGVKSAPVSRRSWDALRAAASRIAPDATVVVVPRDEATVVVQGEPVDPACAADLEALGAAAARLAADWERIEIVGPQLGVAVRRLDPTGELVGFWDLLLGRHAPTRFRAESQRVLVAT